MPTKPATKKQDTMPAVSCKVKLFKIGEWTILQLPKSASEKLPSRGQIMVEGTINGMPLKTPLEPDGNWSHWFRVGAHLQKAINAGAGDIVSLQVRVTKNWPEPPVPADLQKALAGDQQINELWQRITPLARWEWIRWIRSTGKDETRKKRIAVACSKMKSGERRPCCWNRNLCTEPSVSKNGVLLERAAAEK
jgi:hypothetical protein